MSVLYIICNNIIFERDFFSLASIKSILQNNVNYRGYINIVFIYITWIKTFIIRDVKLSTNETNMEKFILFMNEMENM